MRTRNISVFEEVQTLQAALTAWEVANLDLNSVYIDSLVLKYKKDVQNLKSKIKFDFKETIRKKAKAVNDDWKF